MELSIARRLLDLNRRFYAEHAENFAESRPRLPVGVQRVLAAIPPHARVLEAGGGDGKVARALARTGVTAYLGLDLSEALLERAQRYTKAERLDADSIQFRQADLADPSWTTALPVEPFDWVLAFAVFHHLPGHALRTRVLQDLAACLHPGGRAALSNWIFTRSPRLLRRVAPWEQAGLRAEDVEPGDYLLTWQRSGQAGLRYVHALDEPEARHLAATANLQVIETFQSDGLTNDLSDYIILEKPMP